MNLEDGAQPLENVISAAAVNTNTKRFGIIAQKKAGSTELAMLIHS